MKIAVLKYSTGNLGDDFQSFALERLLPNVDVRFDRDDLSPAEMLGKDDKLIINGWFCTGHHRVWPLRTQAEVLHIGMFAADRKVLPKVPLYPIGCRDLWTYNMCLKYGIKAWLSWCATLTLDLPISNERKKIVFVDVPENALTHIPKSIARTAVTVTHIMKNDTKNRVGEVKKRLDMYSESKLVVTGRLHACLPCLAMGIPVVLIPRPEAPERYSGYRDLAWNPSNAPWESPYPKTPASWIHGMAHSFRETVRVFAKKRMDM